MKLNQLLKGADVITILGNRQIEIENISYDSKQLKGAGLFFAVKGYSQNGADFIDEAIERGAICIVSESDFITYKSVCKVLVKDIRKAIAIIANNFYGYPSEKIDITAVTGTNGKTTILYLIDSILQHCGRSCGTIGTISYNIGERKIPAVNTTPSSIMLQMFLNEMVNAGIPNCVMEVSSHSLHQHRVDGIRYRRAIFTNLTSEHLDYHANMDEYFKAKKMLFDMLGEDAYAISNIDDGYGKKITEDTKAKALTYAINKEADIMAYGIKSSMTGSLFKVKTPSANFDLKTNLIGLYNIYNILAAVSFAVSKGLDFKNVQEAVEKFKGAPGRLQRIDTKASGFGVFVDYAHTDDALLNVLSTLKAIAKARLIVVFGCGGDRDKAKRPRMGKVAAGLADFVIVTTDNPRTEEPRLIIEDICKGIPAGFKNYKVYLDRKRAIEASLDMAGANDIVLIAGKGHEKYQIFKDVTVPFDDCNVAQEFIESMPNNKNHVYAKRDN